MNIEIYPEGTKSHQIGMELKSEFEKELASSDTILVYEPQNLTLVESLVVAVAGQVIGHVLKKMVDKIMDAKKDEKTQDVNVAIKFIDTNKQFQLPKDEIFLRAYLES